MRRGKVAPITSCHGTSQSIVVLVADHLTSYHTSNQIFYHASYHTPSLTHTFTHLRRLLSPTSHRFTSFPLSPIPFFHRDEPEEYASLMIPDSSIRAIHGAKAYPDNCGMYSQAFISARITPYHSAVVPEEPHDVVLPSSGMSYYHPLFLSSYCQLCTPLSPALPSYLAISFLTCPNTPSPALPFRLHSPPP